MSIPIPDPPTRDWRSWLPGLGMVLMLVVGVIVIVIGADEGDTITIEIGAGLTGTAIAWLLVWLGIGLMNFYAERERLTAEAKARFEGFPWKRLVLAIVLIVGTGGLYKAQKFMWSRVWMSCQYANNHADSREEIERALAEAEVWADKPGLFIPAPLVGEEGMKQCSSARLRLEKMPD